MNFKKDANGVLSLLNRTPIVQELSTYSVVSRNQPFDVSLVGKNPSLLSHFLI